MGCAITAASVSIIRHPYTIPLSDAGAVELRNEIGRVLGVELPGTLIFDYPTISAMSTMLAAKLSPKTAVSMQEPPSRQGQSLNHIDDCVVKLSPT